MGCGYANKSGAPRNIHGGIPLMTGEDLCLFLRDAILDLETPD